MLRLDFAIFMEDQNLENYPYAFLMQHHDDIKIQAKRLTLALEQLAAPHRDDLTRVLEFREFQAQCERLLVDYDLARERQEAAERSWIDSVHDNLITMHLYRILLSFTRLTDELLVRLMNDAKWFDTLNQSFASMFDFDQSLSILNFPTAAFNLLSVALLGLRFLIESTRILRRTFFPTTEAEQAVGAWARFCHEVYNYRFKLANDIVWATLNGLSNYPDFFNLSAPVANGLILICVCFDMSVMLYQRHLENQAYEKSKTAYEAEPNETIRRALLFELEKDYVENSAQFQLCLLGVTTLVTGFTLLVTASVPIVAPLGSFLCLLGTAIYTGIENYGDYQKKAYLAEVFATTEAIQAQQEAWNKGWSSLIKHATLPPLLFGALAISWPIGLLLIMSSCIFEYSQSSPEKSEPEPGLPAPP